MPRFILGQLEFVWVDNIRNQTAVTVMLGLSGRVKLMVMHGGVKNNSEHQCSSHELTFVFKNCRRCYVIV